MACYDTDSLAADMTGELSVNLKDGGGLSASAGVFVDLSRCKVTLSSAQSIPDVTETVVNWTAESFDTDDYHDVSVNNSRLTVPATGVYLLNGYASFAATVTTSGIRLRKNGSGGQFFYVPGSVTTFGEVSATLVTDLTIGDYVEMLVFQNGGASKNLSSTNSFFSIVRLA